MNKKTKLALRGFLALNSNEQNDFIRNLNNYREMSPAQKRAFENDLDQEERQDFSERVGLGPLSSEPCPCCGK
jgi:hypothetical protein